MPTAYTSLLGFALPVTGELSGTWGDTVNQYITQYVDAAVAGAQTISGSQTAVTLSVTNGTALSQAGAGATGSAQYQIINCTGNPASALTVTVPSSSRTYLVLNNTSTNQTVTVKGAATTGVTVAAARSALIAWNGTDFELVATDDASKISGILAVANGGTGLSSGTSGGVPYFSGSTTMASSAALAANALVVGGGAGAAPSTVTTGTGVVTALGVNTGTAGAFVVNGGALGTPSSGTVTNLTGTASININGTVGATTANTGAFTTLTATSATVTGASGVLTRAAATQDGVEMIGRAGGTLSYKVSITPTTLTASRTVTLPDADINFTTGLAVANGGTGSTTAAGARTNLGATTVGSNFFTLANPSAITFIRVNADNTVSTLDAATFRTAIGAGTGGGSVTSVSGTGTVSGISLSGTVTTSGSLTLGGTLDLSSPPAIGGTTPNTGAFTSITSTSAAGVLTRAAATQDGIEMIGRVGGTLSYKVSITPTTLTASRTLTAPDVSGTIITTGDTGTVTNTMLAGSIANNKLANSTISGVALGSNLNTLTLNTSGTGLSGSTTYNGSGAATFTVTSNATSANTASTIVARDASGNFSAGTITATLSGNATNVTGTVAVANGGTGATSLTANNVILGNGTSAVQFVAPGTNGNVLTSNGTTWTSAAVSGGLSYIFRTTAVTLTDKQGVLTDTSAGAFTVTLPATPATGAQVVVADAGNAWGTNNLTVGRNGSTIQGLAEDLVCNITGASVQFVYDGTTWEIYSQIGAQGGTVVLANITNTFTAAQTFRAANAVRSEAAATQDAVVLAGRAGGTGSFASTITPTTLTASRTVTLPDANTTVPVATQVLTFSGPTAARTITLPDANTTVPTITQALTFTGPTAARTITLPDENFSVGFRNLPAVGTKTASYTLATGDVGKYVQLSTGGAIVIPTSTFAEGDAITLFNNTTGNITITCSAPTAYIAGTNTVKTSMTLATRGVATVLFISSTLCVVTGNVT